MTHLSLAKTAMGEPATAQSVKSMRVRGAKRTVAGLVPIAAGVAVGYTFEPDGWAVSIAIVSYFAALLLLPSALLGTYHAWRARRILRAYPWQVIPCERVPDRGIYQLRIEMAGFAGDRVLQAVAYVYTFMRYGDEAPETIWYAGPPTGRGVVAHVGGRDPFRVVPVRAPDAGVLPHQPHRASRTREPEAEHGN